jgi:2-keto-4-pentenoate hydratase
MDPVLTVTDVQLHIQQTQYMRGNIGVMLPELQPASSKDIDIRNIDAAVTNNGEVVAKGISDAVLGNPVTR